MVQEWDRGVRLGETILYNSIGTKNGRVIDAPKMPWRLAVLGVQTSSSIQANWSGGPALMQEAERTARQSTMQKVNLAHRLHLRLQTHTVHRISHDDMTALSWTSTHDRGVRGRGNVDRGSTIFGAAVCGV